MTRAGMMTRRRAALPAAAPVLCGVIALVSISCASNPAFVGKALPQVIASDEKKLAANPGDKALILETGKYYISYANAFVETPAGMLPPEEHEKKAREQKRARALYLKGAAILETAGDTGDDVDFLYWKAAGYLAAFAIDPFDYASGLDARLPQSVAMLERAYRIDPDYGGGALDELLFQIYASLPAALGGDRDKARAYFESALEKTKGLRPGIFVTWAQAVSTPAQDYTEYKAMLEKALAINPSRDKANVIANKINQTKARWLLKNAGYFFIEVH
jgi:predicted anti-sigma-YlaC factor YlaD